MTKIITGTIDLGRIELEETEEVESTEENEEVENDEK